MLLEQHCEVAGRQSIECFEREERERILKGVGVVLELEQAATGVVHRQEEVLVEYA